MRTAAEAISFHAKLQDEAAKFYEELNGKFLDSQFLLFAEEHRKHKRDVQRTYYYVITDAMEACFAFDGINEKRYVVDGKLAENISYVDAVKKAVEIEDNMHDFCIESASCSKGMLHDVPEALEFVAKRCVRRKKKLCALMEKAK